MRVQSAISPMHVSISTITVGGSNTQLYDTELQEYLPDYRLTPIVIALKAQKEEDGVVSEVISFVDTLVYELVGTGWVQRNSTATFVINTSAGTITIKENTPINSERRFKIDTKIADSRRVDVPYLASVESSIGCKIMSDSPFKLVSEYLDGQGAYVIKPLDNYRLQEKMMKGTTEWIQTYFRWYRRINNVNTEITSENAKGITGLDTGVLSIPYVEIPDRGVSYKCVADPAVDLTGVNLISKKMISDDLNAIAPGCSTPGQDADGKYIQLNTKILQNAPGVETTGGVVPTDDVFQGKIKYKNNQSYRISIRGKQLGFIVFNIVFTDGTKQEIPAGTSTVTINSYATSMTKTIRNIYIYVSSHGLINIYDIQLVEYHGATNLVKGGKLFNPGVGTNILTPLSGKTYSLSCESIKSLVGNQTNFLCNLLNVTDGNTIIVSRILSNSNKLIIFPTTGMVAGKTYAIYLYPGEYYNTSYRAEFTNLMLVEGNYTESFMPKYSPADGEFIPAIPDGAPKPPLSGNAKTDIMVLSRKYPANYNERVVQTYNSNLPGNVENVFGARMDLDTAAGTIQRPELSYSCLWYEKPLGGAESLLAKGFNILETYNETLDIRTEVKQGLDDAKWAAKFNGVDQYLQNNNPANLVPWGTGAVRSHVVEFILKQIGGIQCMLLVVSRDSGSNLLGLSLIIDAKGRVRYGVGVNQGSPVPTPKIYYGTTILKPDILYRIQLDITTNGTYVSTINGVPDVFGEGAVDSFTTPILAIGGSSTRVFNGIILNYSVKQGGVVMANYDFQPNNGDRSNMLKPKDANGNPLNTSTLVPVNISNLDDLNPLTGFFTTI